MLCACGKAGIRRHAERCARCHHIVDQKHMPSDKPRTAPGVGADRPGEVRKAFVPPFSVLQGRLSMARQKIGAMFKPGQSGNGPRKKCGLVIAPPKEARPMQRHRCHQHVWHQKRRGGARHPGGNRSHQIQTVGVFQRQNHLAPFAAVGADGPPPVPGARQCQAVVAIFRPPLVRAGQGGAAAVTNQTADESHLAPAGATEAEIRRDLPPAGDAGGRKYNMECAF